MPFVKILIHAVWATKDWKPYIDNQEIDHQKKTFQQEYDEFRGLLKIQFPLIISPLACHALRVSLPRASRGGETGLPSQRHGMRLKKEIIEFLEPPL